MGQEISIYTQIGLILLLGMSAKNAILIVEYAMDFRKAGVPILKAAHHAGVTCRSHTFPSDNDDGMHLCFWSDADVVCLGRRRQQP